MIMGLSTFKINIVVAKQKYKGEKIAEMIIAKTGTKITLGITIEIIIIMVTERHWQYVNHSPPFRIVKLYQVEIQLDLVTTLISKTRSIQAILNLAKDKATPIFFYSEFIPSLIN